MLHVMYHKSLKLLMDIKNSNYFELVINGKLSERELADVLFIDLQWVIIFEL